MLLPPDQSVCIVQNGKKDAKAHIIFDKESPLKMAVGCDKLLKTPNPILVETYSNACANGYEVCNWCLGSWETLTKIDSTEDQIDKYQVISFQEAEKLGKYDSTFKNVKCFIDAAKQHLEILKELKEIHKDDYVSLEYKSLLKRIKLKELEIKELRQTTWIFGL